jgi:ribosomal protein L37AE/L43A
MTTTMMPTENRITDNGSVTVKRAAIKGWSCDGCHTLGEGWDDIKAHFARTEHRVYSEMR